MTVTVGVGEGRPLRLAHGGHLVIGRDAGPGQLGAEDRTVSRRHGIITAGEAHWTVEATGTRSGLVVYDHETPSRLLLCRGVGPVVVPFASASVVIEVKLRRYAVTVEGPGAPGWAGSWASTIGDGTQPPAPGETHIPWEIRWKDSTTGKPLRWYQTLVAMCEPFLRHVPDAVVPTNSQIAHRLVTSEKVIGSRLMDEVRDQLGFDRYTPNLRQTMVSIAISQRLVTVADLAVLPD
ncbi:hypothetical protein [Aquihabitans sp. McL0605]|uniref:hypothetical protein n=1 Tax=Aquihabitans sp. McL0605 TaxID=3415671 RepID=UPI003CF28CA0